MQRRSLILFVILNVVISVGVALAVIQLANSRGSSSTSLTQVITVEVVYTATPAPTQTPFIVTATPPTGVVILPPDLLGTPGAASSDTGGSTGTSGSPAPTIDPAVLAASGGDPSLLGTALPENCILHTIVEGDTPFAIAEQYGADGFALLEVNGLTEETSVFLQIGQVLIVPLEGCSLTQNLFSETADTGVEDVTEEAPTPTAGAPASTDAPTATPSPTSSATLPPTAENAQMQIVGIRNPGVITQEYIEILNTGNTVSILNWVIRDGQGSEYRFAEQLLFSRGSIRVYTGSGGTDTPNVKYWGLPSAVWEAGDVATLIDSDGQVQATFVVP